VYQPRARRLSAQGVPAYPSVSQRVPLPDPLNTLPFSFSSQSISLTGTKGQRFRYPRPGLTSPHHPSLRAPHAAAMPCISSAPNLATLLHPHPSIALLCPIYSPAAPQLTAPPSHMRITSPHYSYSSYPRLLTTSTLDTYQLA